MALHRTDFWFIILYVLVFYYMYFCDPHVCLVSMED